MIALAATAALARTVPLGCPLVGQVATFRVRTELTYRESRSAVVSLGEVETRHHLEVLSVEGPQVRFAWSRAAELLRPPSDPLAAEYVSATAGHIGDAGDVPLVLVVDLSQRMARIENVAPLLRVNESFYDALEPRLPVAVRERYRDALLDPVQAEAAALEPLEVFTTYVCREVRTGRSTRASALPVVEDEVPVAAVRATTTRSRFGAVRVAVDDRPLAEAVSEALVARRASTSRVPPDGSLALGRSVELRARRGGPWLDAWSSVNASIDVNLTRWESVVVAERIRTGSEGTPGGR